ncbi:NAD-dependent epimerase/dehydratase family protein [Planctomycetota bacterium]
MVDLEQQRILVTGAAGFVGANLVRALVHRGALVHALVRASTSLWRLRDVQEQLAVHVCDLTERDRLTRTIADIEPRVVFHLAATRQARTPAERLSTLTDNVLATHNLLEASAASTRPRFIHAASSMEYGHQHRPLHEALPLNPVTFPGVTKAASTLIALWFAENLGLPLTSLRIFSVYGYWEGHQRLLPTTILKVLRDEPLSLTSPGLRRDFVFVEDVVEACLLAVHAEETDGEVINVGSGTQHCNEDVVSLIQTLMDRRIEVRVGAYASHASDSTHWVADNTKALRLLGWRPAHSLRQGLEKMISWFRDHAHLYPKRLGRPELEHKEPGTDLGRHVPRR